MKDSKKLTGWFFFSFCRQSLRKRAPLNGFEGQYCTVKKKQTELRTEREHWRKTYLRHEKVRNDTKWPELNKTGHKQGREGYGKPKAKCQIRTSFGVKESRGTRLSGSIRQLHQNIVEAYFHFTEQIPMNVQSAN